MLKKSILIKLCCTLYFVIPIWCNSSVVVVLDGLDSELENNVYRNFSNIDFNVTNINIVDFQKKINDAIISGLKPFGYYSPIIETDFNQNFITNKNLDKLIIKINPGTPVKVVAVNIHIFGDGQYDFDYQKIVESGRFFIGKKLNHNDYEQLKNKIYNLAMSKGYFDAKFQKSQLVVIPDLYQSIWNITFDSGSRYIYEKINFKGSQIRLDYLKNICNVRLGEYYNTKSILELNKRLSSTNWFESIITSSDFVKSSQKKN